MQSHNQYSVPDGPGLPNWLKLLLTVGAATGIAFGGMAIYKRTQQKTVEAEPESELQSDLLRDLDPGAADAINAARSQEEKKPLDGGKAKRAFVDLGFEIQSKSRAYLAAREEANLDEFFDPAGVTTPEKLGLQRDSARALMESSTVLHNTVESLLPRYLELLVQEGMPEAQRATYAEAYVIGYERTLPVQRRARTVDSALAKIRIELCDLLEAQSGKWSAKNGEPAFESEESTAKYLELKQRFERASNTRLKAKRDLLPLAL
jgi:hypothetical protein